MHHDVEGRATLMAMRELRGDYAPLTRLQCIVVACFEVWREAQRLDASLPADVRTSLLTRAAANAIARARSPF